jgi:mono/diheme cytochrome c family protein
LTEVPEHLLRRSRERRAALGLEGGETPAAATGEGEAEAAAPAAAAPVPAAAAATPAPAPAAAVEEARVAPPKPEPAYIQAAKQRKRIPFWAMPVLAALPIWGYVYVRTLEPPPTGETDPLVLGTELFGANCASCHGATGGGGAGPAFTDGAVVETWPDWRDHVMWVRLGDANWPGDTYGAQHKPKQSASGMPSFADTLTDQEIAQIVLHERELAGEDVSEDNPVYTGLFAVANGEMTLGEAEGPDGAPPGLGPLSQEAGVNESELGG